MDVLRVGIGYEHGLVDFALSGDEKVFHGTFAHEHGSGNGEGALGLVEFDHADLVAAPAEWDDVGLHDRSGRLLSRREGLSGWCRR